MGSEARAALTVLLVAGLSCATEGVRRFPLAEPMWADPDANPLPRMPATRQVGANANMIDQTAMRPVSRALTIPVRTEAPNVNSLDEVPNSSWFTNRIGLFPMSPAEVARGACGPTPPLDPARGPWVVVSGKPEGTNPGFVVKAPDGHRYLLKFDGPVRGQRGTAADVLGSKIYHAAGYHTPCNEIVSFREEILALSPDATVRDRYGRKVPMKPGDVETILAMGWRRPDGQVRASASRYLEGTSIGPFRYEGTRADDPNDVIPHEKRRELRASKLFAAWIHHWDAIEQNTIDLVVEEGGRRFVRHHILDWGDSLGKVWDVERVNRRIGVGRGGHLDLDQVLVDLFTLGLYPRPWYRAPTSPEPEIFGYFDAANFAPAQWRGTYVNAAFEQMTDRDALWGARIIARFSDAHVAAIVAEARFEDPRSAAFVEQTLIARRDAILREYLTRLSPLGAITLTRSGPSARQSLCFDDLAVETAIVGPGDVLYRVHLQGGERLDQLLGWTQLRPAAAAPARTCLPLPLGPARPHALARAGAPDDDPRRYAVLEIYANHRRAAAPTSLLLVHLYDLGPARGFRVVGIERPREVPALP